MDYMKGNLNVTFCKLTIAQLCVAEIKHAKGYYFKNGRITSEVSNIQLALYRGTICGPSVFLMDARVPRGIIWPA